MTDDTVTHEQIEGAFKPAADLVARLPTEGMDGYAGKRATEALRVAEDYVHQHREKLRPERTEAVSGPAESVTWAATATYANTVHLTASPDWPRRSGRCSYPSAYCSCGSTNQGG